MDMNTNNYDDMMSDEELKQRLERMDSNEVVDLYMRGLLVEKGITGLDPETEEDVVMEMKSRLDDLFIDLLIDAIPDDEVEDISSRFDDGENPDDVIREVVERNGIDADAILADALETFTSLYLGNGDN